MPCGVPSMLSAPEAPNGTPTAIRAEALARFEADGVATSSPSFDLWLERCTVWLGMRERTKATCVLTINEQRLDASRSDVASSPMACSRRPIRSTS